MKRLAIFTLNIFWASHVCAAGLVIGALQFLYSEFKEPKTTDPSEFDSKLLISAGIVTLFSWNVLLIIILVFYYG